ncbi:MAG: alpha/beta hydrolase [Nocardioides sp.]|jgi:pimeloyl-ACP methyl ester carboxylesterase
MGWSRIQVDDRPAAYGHAGSGPVVLFLHGWAISNRTYRRSLAGLARRGFCVLAPELPGFGGTAPLPRESLSLSGYADWVVRFLDARGVADPVTVIAHSFGGAVAIKAAHAHPDRIDRLILVNSIGGATWREVGDQHRLMTDRPLWDWGVHLSRPAFSGAGLLRVFPVVAADAARNAARHPLTMWRVGRLAREAALAAELEDLKRRRFPVVVLWGSEDTVVPRACAQSLVDALHAPHLVTVPGDHDWLIRHPRRFVEEVTNVIGADGPAA